MPDCTNHKKDLFGETDMKKVAEAIGDLHYEALSELLGSLSIKLYRDGLKDLDRDRYRLSCALDDASNRLRECADHVTRAWNISKKYMKQ